ncbi:glycoside hydrolase family 99-like domain-containing protein [Novosphingobium sp.]|uniref:glycoside hydrolase family 99-like domain-containing protein n=1 Tax=Novosphingobium sp. TaxID=1874826 RepID=UPI00286E94B9|nr:glycoside hydrolase family 99-like domain-containing protein [Novosphingobium sp.]
MRHSPDDVQAIAIHLPQFHPIPENDEWWGKGFTEWTNVAKAKPLFPGHDQPRLPADLGFYDLRLDEVRAAQAEMAKAYGISAFCYYHYWFNGRRILERPVQEIHASGEPDFPFCLCWANENWTRTWDGTESSVLLHQDYSPDDDRAHIRSLIPLFSDPRYLRIDGKIAFFVYRSNRLPDPAATVAIWREEVGRAGLGELFLGEFTTSDVNLATSGFDVAVEFAPSPYALPKQRRFQRLLTKIWCRSFARTRGTRQAAIHLYDDLCEAMVGRETPAGVTSDRWLRCVSPSWDNSPRRKDKPLIFIGSTPGKYEAWLRSMVRWTRSKLPPGRRFVFINAWNEWAEGNFLEPDQKNGHAYLEATKRALSSEANE